MAGADTDPFGGLEETNEFHLRAADRMSSRVAEHTQQAKHEDWEGANMHLKPRSIGCRIALQNFERKLFASGAVMEGTSKMMTEHRIDVLIAMEPGKGDEPRMKALHGVASKKMEKIIAKSRGGNTSCGGVVVWLSRAWSTLDVTVTHCQIKGAEDRLLALEFDNHKRGEHNKTLIIEINAIWHCI